MSTIQRTFMPGSRWVYIKLYTGQKTADDLLVKVITSITNKLYKGRYIEKWFFVRYLDSDFHLRIRLRVYDTQHIGKIICLFHQKLHQWNTDQLLWKTQLDTYNRELERYGERTIEEAESIFYADSECILSIIKKLSGNEDFRWMIALVLIDSLLNDFSYSLENKQSFLTHISESFKYEFGFNQYNSKQFNDKFREKKKVVELVLQNKYEDKNFSLMLKAIEKRSKKLYPTINLLTQKIKKDKATLDSLLSSYIHMTMNRIFRSNGRTHELILYDFMRRYYTSEMAKQKYAETNTKNK